MFALLLLFTSISVVAQDFAELTEMAEQGQPVAQNKLGIIYASGNGVEQDFNKAAELFEKSANQDLPSAQYNLGRLYQMGQGVPQDDAIAADWTRKAAESGDAKAQYTLGFMYANGKGVPRNPETAALWIAKAADQGLPIAQQAIEQLKSITQDLQQAEVDPISAEAMSAVVRPDGGNQDGGGSAAVLDVEEQNRKAEALARIRQARASGDGPQAPRKDTAVSETGQSSQSFLEDRRVWIILSGVLILLGIYWLLRARP